MRSRGRPKKRPGGQPTITFDPKALSEFVTGFSKRKAQRREAAAAQKLAKEKEERRRLRRERQELMEQHVTVLEVAREKARDCASKSSTPRKPAEVEVIDAWCDSRSENGSVQRAVQHSRRGRTDHFVPEESLEAGRAGGRCRPDWRAAESGRVAAAQPLQTTYLLPSSPAGGDLHGKGERSADRRTARLSDADAGAPWLLGCTVTASVGGFFGPMASVSAPGRDAGHECRDAKAQLRQGGTSSEIRTDHSQDDHPRGCLALKEGDKQGLRKPAALAGVRAGSRKLSLNGKKKRMHQPKKKKGFVRKKAQSKSARAQASRRRGG
ncbi:nucleolar 25 kda protein [Cystoisospora suis]|uniref:Nucleolar 25 kDa protein n=1 Tax=Cystoisospora suis TaxID=483139 RepID=A0A2C6L0W5_9APIC|nr:nucleolar 25 kda protein [Cystoisospora suis]